MMDGNLFKVAGFFVPIAIMTSGCQIRRAAPDTEPSVITCSFGDPDEVQYFPPTPPKGLVEPCGSESEPGPHNHNNFEPTDAN